MCYDRIMELLVKEYLRHHTFRELEKEHGVNARPNVMFDKFTLNYDMIDAKPGDPISEQCRGLVIRPRPFSVRGNDDSWKDHTVGDVEVLAWPMNRFYNYGDTHAADVNWTDKELRVYEKVDGTCIILYWDPLHDRWYAGTRSVPEADLPIVKDHLEIGNMTFAELFLRALVETREELEMEKVVWPVHGIDNVIHLNKELTYVFELVSPYNQVVVVYPQPRVYLLAVRHTATGKEEPIEKVRLQWVRRPKTWPIRDVVTLSAFVDNASPSELEGAVACDSHFRRMKVKNKTYVLAHRSKDTVTSSVRNALECVILEKVDDIVPLVPKEVGDRLLRMQYEFGKYCKEIDARVAEFRKEADGSRKHYASLVNLSGDWGAPYFNMWENKAKSAREWFKSNCEKNKLSPGSLDTIIERLTL